jgi:hypothetical protein
MPVILATQGSINSRIVVQTGGKSRDPISKITRAERASSLVQGMLASVRPWVHLPIPPKTKNSIENEKLTQVQLDHSVISLVFSARYSHNSIFFSMITFIWLHQKQNELVLSRTLNDPRKMFNPVLWMEYLVHTFISFAEHSNCHLIYK